MGSAKTAVTNNEFNTIFNEVCEYDYYRVRSLPFTPDLVLDIGANVGVFTTLARFLFPKAQVIAVEPDPRNFGLLLQHTSHFPNVEYVNKALGTGPIWEGIPSLRRPYYGAIHSYITPNQLGFPTEQLASLPGLDGRDGLPPYSPSEVTSITLDKLVEKFTQFQSKVLLKMDCEGGENYIFNHNPSMRALRRADFLTMEMHYYTKGTGTEQEKVEKQICKSLLTLSDTHNCLLNANTRYFQAIRKELDD